MHEVKFYIACDYKRLDLNVLSFSVYSFISPFYALTIDAKLLVLVIVLIIDRVLPVSDVCKINVTRK